MSRVARCQGVNIDVAKGGAVSVGILFFSYCIVHMYTCIRVPFDRDPLYRDAKHKLVED